MQPGYTTGWDDADYGIMLYVCYTAFKLAGDAWYPYGHGGDLIQMCFFTASHDVRGLDAQSLF